MDKIDEFLSRLHFVGDDDFLFAVPLDTPTELQERMFAAWKAYGSAHASIDDILDEHRDAWNFDQEDRTELQVVVDEVVLPARDLVYEALLQWSSPTRNFRSVGQFSAGAALMRLQSSFTVLSLLTRFGFGFEGASISRLILEQIAWAYAVRDFADEGVLEVSPSRSIAGLKGILPWTGRLYGRLSEYTHIDPSLASEYIDTGVGFSSVLIRRPTYWSPMLAWVFTLLADAYVIVSELLFPSEEPSSIKLRNGEIHLQENRRASQLISQASNYALFDL